MSQHDPCFECKALQIENDAITKLNIERTSRILWLEGMLASTMQTAIDIGQRLRLRMTDDTQAWPGDRSVLLELDRLQSQVYRKEFCEKR